MMKAQLSFTRSLIFQDICDLRLGREFSDISKDQTASSNLRRSFVVIRVAYPTIYHIHFNGWVINHMKNNIQFSHLLRCELSFRQVDFDECLLCEVLLYHQTRMLNCVGRREIVLYEIVPRQCHINSLTHT